MCWKTKLVSCHCALGGLNMSLGRASSRREDRLTSFLTGNAISPFVSIKLTARIEHPIKFVPPGGGAVAYGYEATLLADICDVVLNARKAGALLKQQEYIPERCEILLRGFARVGIIAMVDEVTGYQYLRSRRSLEQILDKFLRKELGKWAKRFPDAEFLIVPSAKPKHLFIPSRAVLRWLVAV
jgi:hypothetical protein